jgi:hypothetical protein
MGTLDEVAGVGGVVTLRGLLRALGAGDVAPPPAPESEDSSYVGRHRGPREPSRMLKLWFRLAGLFGQA